MRKIIKSRMGWAIIACCVWSPIVGAEVKAEGEGAVKPLAQSSVYEIEGMDNSFKIVRPTVFFYFRDPELLAKRDTGRLMKRIVKLVNERRSVEFGYSPSAIDPWTENIAIMEEKMYWTVVFQLRGNGYVWRWENGRYAGYSGYRPHRIYYVSKDGKEVLSNVPDGAIVRVPDYGPVADLLLETSYPDEDVGSFIGGDTPERLEKEKEEMRSR